MYHYGTIESGGEGAGAATAAAAAAEAMAFVVDGATYSRIREVPVPALECRATVLTHFVERGILHEEQLPASLSQSEC
jgi:hypothetical protein